MSDLSNHVLAIRARSLFSGVAVCLAMAPSVVLAQEEGVCAEIPVSPYRLHLANGDAYRFAAVHRPPLPEPALAHLPFAAQIESAAKASGLDPALVHALIAIESGHRQDAVSPKGAIGLMQLMPATAVRYGVRAPGKSPEDNLRAGTAYLRDLMVMFDNRLDLVLAAYNAGEGAVMRYRNRIPPYRETRDYVPAVLQRYSEWRSLAAKVAPARATYLEGTRLDPQVLGAAHRGFATDR